MRYLLLAATIILASCTKEVPTAPPAAQDLSTDYAKRLFATKSKFQFEHWPSGARTAVTGVFERLLSELVVAGEGATEQQKIGCFTRAVAALNEIDRRDRTVIETDEAEQLVDIGNEIAKAAGLDPKKYGHGEGPLSAGRNW